MIEIKNFFGDWKEATREQAEAFYKHFKQNVTVIKWEDKQKYFNDNYIRGGYVSLRGKVETIEERQERVFNVYKERLIKECFNLSIRFNVVEYLCNSSQINPFELATQLIKEGITILFDDSSINSTENKRKERQVYKLVQWE